MAWRITDLVVDGEIDNTGRGRVRGWIQLRDNPEPLVLDLEGDCAADLAGWRFRLVRTDPTPPWAKPVDITGLVTQQFGEVGTITADQMLRHYDCSPLELSGRIRADEPPPTEWRKALCLEWYSIPNGRVVIQDTRLAVERLGQRAFELTDEDLRQKREAAEKNFQELREQGFQIDLESGIVNIAREESDDADDGLQAYLDAQTQEMEQRIKQSLDEPASGDVDEGPIA